MQATTAMSDALGQYLDLTSGQMKLTASNMANVDTPGYKTQGFDFEQAFARQLNNAAGADGLGSAGCGAGCRWSGGAAGWEQCVDGSRGNAAGEVAVAVQHGCAVVEA